MYTSHRKILTIVLVIFINTIVLVNIIGCYKNTVQQTETVKSSPENLVTEIYSVEDYMKFAQSVTNENSYEHYEVDLCADLDFSKYKDVPVIGNAPMDEDAIAFSGTFNGNGHLISGIRILNPEGRAAMFARLEGVVKNLCVTESVFEGKLCGAIAAENYKSAILNCYVDAVVRGEVAGAIVGECYGQLFNCVSSVEAEGKFRHGTKEHCYLIGEENISALNNNLYHISGYYQDSEFCEWEANYKRKLSNKKMALLEKLTARLMIDGKEIKFNGYYSVNDRQWYVVLPATYGEEELYIEVITSDGGFQSFKRAYGEETILFAYEEYYYPINFIVADNVDTIYITLENNMTLKDIHADKREKISGIMEVMDKQGNIIFEIIKGFYGHGNSSWEAEKKSYNLKLDSYVDLLGMGENDDFVLLAGYRWNSLMSYVTSNELAKEVEFPYTPEFRLTNLYVNGDYEGIYFLTEKIEIDKNRIEIDNLQEKTEEANSVSLKECEYIVWHDKETKEKICYYDIPNNPLDITGGYLLELDMVDHGPVDSRFTTIGEINKVILKRARYSTKKQVEYIAEYWQNFESAVLSETGYNEEGKYYTDYIDLESFAMQWLMYELSMESNLAGSVYYYKESDLSGDGKMHACCPWDLERSFENYDEIDSFGSVNSKGNYWSAFYKHADFRNELKRVWNTKFIPAIEYMILKEAMENEKGVKNLAWYEESLSNIQVLENTRWASDYFIEKTEMIKEILMIRKDVITSHLPKY